MVMGAQIANTARSIMQRVAFVLGELFRLGRYWVQRRQERGRGMTRGTEVTMLAKRSRND